MQVGALMGLPVNSLAVRVVPIAAVTYPAGGVNTPVQTVTVSRGFLTPPGHVTNAHVAPVKRIYGDTPNGVFLRDRHTGYYHMYAMGEGNDAREFNTIDPRLLPPHLGIGDNFETWAENPHTRARLEFGTEVRRVLPREDRYEQIRDEKAEEAAQQSDVALTCVDSWMAQAMAQLLGNPIIAQELFGLSGLGEVYYADLLTSEQWGAMAMEGVFAYMTSTGLLTAADGAKLRAHDLPHIAKATDYKALPNGVLPNTVWDRVKDFVEQGIYQVLRGGSWYINDGDSLRSAYRYNYRPANVNESLGLRVGFFPRTT